MYLKSLRLQNLKLIREMELNFTRDGEVRPWTVLIGQNGRGKTAILQAIALAAAGELHANDLGKTLVQSLPTRLEEGTTEFETSIEATFALAPPPRRGKSRKRVRELPERGDQGEAPVEVSSSVRIPTGYNTLSVSSWYGGLANPPNERCNVLKQARSRGLPYWFVAGYGVSRHLRFSQGGPAAPPNATELQLERLRTLFDSDARLRAIGFANMFESRKARLFARFIRALMTEAENLLPELANIELRGHGGVTRPEDLLDRDRIIQQLPNTPALRLPATWLSHGYQSSLSWLSDLLGHALIEDAAFDNAQNAHPSELQGLVLIDELDLHLHPSWQRTFIRALGKTFPKLQFIATTHSPMLISALRPDEVIALEYNPQAGQIVHRESLTDPRFMTGGEIYREFFDTSNLYLQELGEEMRVYRFWASNPYRSDEKDARMKQAAQRLHEAGVKLPLKPVERDDLPEIPRAGGEG